MQKTSQQYIEKKQKEFEELSATVQLLDNQVFDMIFDYNKQILYVCERTEIKIYKNIENKQKQEIGILKGHTKDARCLALSSDNKILYSGSEDNNILIWDTEQKLQIGKLEGHTSYLRCIALSSNDKILYSGSRDKTIRAWDTQQQKEIGKFEGQSQDIRCMILSNDNNFIYSGGQEKSIKIWDTNQKKLVGTIEGHSNYLRCLALSSDDKILYSGGLTTTIRKWDLQTKEQIGTLEGHSNNLRCLTLSSDNKILYSGSTDQTIRIWDTQKMINLGILEGHSEYVRRIVLSLDNRVVYSSSEDKTIRIWNTKQKKEMEILKGHQDKVHCIVLSSDNKYLYSGSQDNTIQIWDLKINKSIGTLKGHLKYISCLVLSTDNKILFSGSEDSTIKIWNVQQQKQIGCLTGHQGDIYCLALTSNNKILYSGSRDKTIRVWNVETQQQTDVLEEHSNYVRCLKLTSDNKFMYSGSRDQTVRVWNMEEKKVIGRLEGHQSDIYSLAVSSDNRFLYTGSHDQTIRIWDTKQKKEIKILEGHTGTVYDLILSSNDRFLYSAGQDKIIRVWDTKQKIQIGHLQGHNKSVLSIVMSSDNRFLYSSSEDNDIRIWGDDFYTIEDFFILNSFLSCTSEQQFLKLCEIFHQNFFQFVFTKHNFNILYPCIQNQYFKALDYILENNLIYWIYPVDMNSPLIAAIESRNEVIIHKIFKYLSKPENIKLISKKDFRFMLQSDYPQVQQFLTKLIVIVDKYCGEERNIEKLTTIDQIQTLHTKTTNFYKSDFTKIKNNSQQKKDQDEQDLRPTKFMKLDIDYDLNLMTKDSAIFLNSYSNSDNITFLTSNYQYLVLYKWQQIRSYYLLLAFLFWLFLIFFTRFLVIQNFIIFIVNCVLLSLLLIYELLSFYISRSEYFKDVYNLLDLYIILHCFYTLISTQFFQDNLNQTFQSYVRIMAVIIVYSRGFIYLKIFDKVRHLIDMIVAVAGSIFSVLIVMIYLMLAMSVMLTQSVVHFSFNKSIEYTYGSIFGAFPEQEEEGPKFDSTLWFVIVLTGVFLPIILTNFLIAKMSSKYTELEEKQHVISLKEQAGIILEMETIMRVFYGKKRIQKTGEELKILQNQIYKLKLAERSNNTKIGDSKLYKINSEEIQIKQVQQRIEKYNQKKLRRKNERRKYLKMVVPQNKHTKLNLSDQDQKLKDKKKKQKHQKKIMTIMPDKIQKIEQDQNLIKNRIENIEQKLDKVLEFLANKQNQLKQLYIKNNLINKFIQQF